VLAVAVIAGLGCGSGTKAPAKPDVPPAKADVLAYLPANSTMVMSIDVAKLRESALWKHYWPKMESAIAPQLASAKEKCGFDPWTSIGTITIGSGADMSNDATFVIRGLPRDQTIACVMKQVIPQTTATMEGNVIALHNQSGSVNMFTFVDASTLVMKGSKTPTKESVLQGTTTGSPLRSDKAFMARFEKLERDPMMWIVLAGKSEVLDKLGGTLGEKPLGSELSLQVTDEIKVAARVQLQDGEGAKRTVEAWTAAAEALAMFMTVSANAQGDTVVFTAAIKQSAIDLMLSQFARESGGALDDPPPPEEEDKPEDGE
jgi:hypothetical protein